MYLKTLTMRGFKSFASTTTFEFEPGLNAIVGPNGSGKSNVVDALAWVMGAQGAKSLRGGSMKDVIFAGGGGRTALGRARVELVIDNSDGALALPYAEISLARTMFSAGGSEYEINGAPARLADVQELLSDTGLGRELHSMVGQGQLDKILHGTAADRRELIEQAAGLVKHRKRQDKTAAKLETMKSNLDRLEDLAGELGEQLEGRREQAETARSAAEVATRVRALTADLLALEAAEVRAQLDADAAAQEQTAGVQERAQKNVESGQARLQELEAAEAEAGAQRDAVATLLTRLDSLHHRVESLALIAAERSGTAVGEVQENDNAQEESVRTQVEAEEKNLAQLEQRLDQVAKRSAELEQGAEEARTKAADARHALETAQSQQAAYRERSAELTGELATARAAFERASAELADRQKELDALKAERGKGNDEHSKAQVQLTALRAELEKLATSEEKARKARRESTGAEAKARQQVHEAEVKVQALTARCEALESALTHDGETTADSAALAQALEAGASALSSQLEVEKGWEKAVATLLGRYADLLVWSGAQPGPQGVSLLVASTENAGDKPVSHQSQLKLEKGSRALADVLTAPASTLTSLHAVLGTVVFCPGDSEAFALLKDVPEVTVVTREGVLRTSYLVLYPGSAGASIELAADLRTAQQELEHARKDLDWAQGQAEQTATAAAQAQETEKQAARLVGACRAQESTARAELARLEAREETASREFNRLSERIQRSQQTLTQAEQTLKVATEALDAHFDTKPQADVPALVEEARTAGEHATAREQELALITAEREHLEEQKEQTLARLNQAQQAQTALGRAREEREKNRRAEAQRQQKARRASIRAQALLAALTSDIDSYGGTKAELVERLADTRQELAQAREELAGAQKSLAASLTLRAEGAAQRARLEARWEALNTRVLDALGIDCAQLLAEDRENTASRESLEANLAIAEKELKRLGVVNPLALEEFEALEQRHSYLQEQIRDVKKSRADLRAVMKNVSTHIEESFDRAFADVAEQFSLIFAELFPGGEGKLVLSDPADKLTSGIDIQARPAGKKVTRLSLLSGGERSLASLALLLAIFMSRPSPFYVLDEVEAALDDRNLGRLLGVLGRLRERSQLIMITHHQRTMVQADTLYGVTMREGVSTVLSQRLPVDQGEN